MDTSGFFNGLLQLLNSAFGLTLMWAAISAFMVWLFTKLMPIGERWKQWEGSIITGIKLAEKQISSDTPNAGKAKRDTALRFVLDAYREAHGGKRPPRRLIEQIKQGIQITHLDLTRYGGLKKSKD